MCTAYISQQTLLVLFAHLPVVSLKAMEEVSSASRVHTKARERGVGLCIRPNQGRNTGSAQREVVAVALEAGSALN